MKAISLWQPWASLMAAGVKHNETRSWQTSHLGDLVVCSAKKRLGYLPVELHGTVFEAFRYGEDDRTPLELMEELPYGAALCVVELFDYKWTGQLDPVFCPSWLTEKERSLGDYSPGRWAWATRNCRRLRNPVPVKGRQGLFNLTPEEEKAVRAALPKGRP